MRRRTNCRFFAPTDTACFVRLVYFRIARQNRPQSQNDDHISESLVPPVPGPCRPNAHSATTRPIYEVRSQTRPFISSDVLLDVFGCRNVSKIEWSRCLVMSIHGHSH